MSGITPANVGTLHEAWHTDLGAGSPLPLVESGSGLLHTVVNRADFVQDVYGLVPGTGAVKWTVPNPGDEFGVGSTRSPTSAWSTGCSTSRSRAAALSSPPSSRTVAPATGAVVGEPSVPTGCTSSEATTS